MSSNVYKVLVAQFVTAFADNAILFTIITMIMKTSEPAAWYIPALQASFIVAFVVLAPWVGPYADGRPKAQVLTYANVLKAVGASMLLFSVEPMIAYAIVGIGAAMYSPAKYGILPELVDEADLVKANGWIEGSTILAILSGTLVGAHVAKISIDLALAMIIVCFILSAVVAMFVTRIPPKPRTLEPVLPKFKKMMKSLLETPRGRFSALAVSLFWSAAAVLRVLLIAWAPVVLFISDTSKIAELTMYIAIGIAIGAVLAAKFIPLEHLRRARLAAYAMGSVIVILSFIDNVWLARVALLAAGIAGGMFVVPINAALQEIGHKTIGSGGAVGIQNFFENLAMLIASGVYAYVAGIGVGPVATMLVLGILVVIAALAVSWHLPKDEDGIKEKDKECIKE